MAERVKPKAMSRTVETKTGRVLKITLSCSNPARPGGLANIVYNQSSWEVRAKLTDNENKEVLVNEPLAGSIMWIRESNYAFAWSETKPWWSSGNCLGVFDAEGKRAGWSYKTSEAALRKLMDFVCRNLAGDVSELKPSDA